MVASNGETSKSYGEWRIPWRPVMAALVLSVASTLLLGGLLVALQPNVWWLAVAGVLSLFIGGAAIGWTTKAPEPLDGTLLAALYYGIVVAVLFGGSLAEALPEPLPGLGIGDSTFFFVWPLLQLTAAVTGSIAGGLWGQRRARKKQWSVDTLM